MPDFQNPQAFSGRLTRGGDHYDVAFELSLTPSGSLVFDFEQMPFTKATAWLRGGDDNGERVSYYSLVAQSGEVTLTTDHLHLNASHLGLPRQELGRYRRHTRTVAAHGRQLIGEGLRQAPGPDKN